MGTLQTWRKTYGAIKDHTKVGLAHVNSDFKDVDVAIVKATNHVECPPKERHLRKILAATSAVRPRADVAYCIHALARRLAKTHNWMVALKTLIVIHRTLREGDPTFREELLNFQQRGRVLQMSNFKDDSSPIAWDCSAWVRTYALFLEERLECFRILKYDIEAERLPRPTPGQDKGYSKTRDLDSEELLEQLPGLQQLLYRLIGCRPEGAAVGNYIIQYALALVLKESFKIYCAVNDGIINLVDKFFEMPRHEAIKALDIYKRAGQQANSLSDFYEVCKGLELARNFQFPVLREPPQSFLVTMEEYIKEAPRMVSVSSVTLEYPERLMLTYKEEDASSPSEETRAAPFEEHSPPPPPPPHEEEVAVPPPPTNVVDTDDLLGLNANTQDASAIEDSNALALAIVPSGTLSYRMLPKSRRQNQSLRRRRPLTFSPFPRLLAIASSSQKRARREDQEPKLQNKDLSFVNDGYINHGIDEAKQSDSSDADESEGVVQADFVFFDPKPSDFHGVKVLLQAYLDNKQWDLSGFVDLILEQPTVGTVVKVENDEDEGVYSVVSALSLGRHKYSKCILELKEYLLKVCQDKDEIDNLKSLVEENAQDVGLVVSQRVVNLPPQLLPPLYDGLFDEIEWATEDEPTEELRSSFRFKYYLIISKIYKYKNAGQSRGKNRSREEDVIYVKPEDEIFYELSSWSFSFPLHAQQVTPDELKNYRPMGLVMAVEASKASKFRKQLHSLIDE